MIKGLWEAVKVRWRIVRDIVRFPISIVISAWSFIGWLTGRNDDTEGRLDRFVHWLEEFPAPRKEGGYGHHLKNKLVEWTRAYSQEAAKFYSFIIVTQAVAVMVLLGVLAVLA